MEKLWSALETPWRICFELMWTAYAANTIPVGAVLVDGDGKIVSSGRNGVYLTSDVGIAKGSRFLHAEVNALSGLDVECRYEDHLIYSSLEPCLLCVGAAVMANVGGIRYAGVDLYGGAAHVEAMNPHIERLEFSVEGPRYDVFGLLAAALHVEFYLRRNPDGHVVRAHRERGPDARTGPLLDCMSWVASNSRKMGLSRTA